VGAIEVVLGRSDGIAVHAGVVDEGVEPADIGFDPLARGVDRLLVGDVQLNGLDPSVRSTSSCFRAPAKTRKPCSAASSRAISAPIPRLAPLTSATRLKSCVARAASCR
jgi:hypothetical protein